MKKLTPLQTLMATAAILGAEGMRDYRERAQAGETTDDDCELYGHGEESESDCEAGDAADEQRDRSALNR